MGKLLIFSDKKGFEKEGSLHLENFEERGILSMENNPTVSFINTRTLSMDIIGELKLAISREGENKYILNDIKIKMENGQFVLNNFEIEFLERNPSTMIEYLLYRYKFRYFPIEHKNTVFPIHLLVEPASTCNLKCIMCFQHDDEFSKGSFMGNMDLELFKSIVDEAVDNNCKSLTFAGRGDPLMNKNIIKFFEYSAGKFYDLKLNTNALLLTDDICHSILKSGITQLVFSVDADNAEEYERIRVGGNFALLIKNILKFNKIKEQYKNSCTRTRICAVKISDAFDSKRFLEFWKNYVDDVAFVEVEDRKNTYSNSKSTLQCACNRLWERLYIWWDGKCSPCDNDYKSLLNIGEICLRGKNIQEIWTQNMEELRKKHLNGERSLFVPCDRCGI